MSFSLLVGMYRSGRMSFEEFTARAAAEHGVQLSERSDPLTPGSPSRLHFQALHRFPGFRPVHSGSTLPRPSRHRAGDPTTRQASLHVTDRSVARAKSGRLTLGFGPARFQTTPPACFRASWQLTRIGLSQASDDELTNQRINRLHDQPPTLLDAHERDYGTVDPELPPRTPRSHADLEPTTSAPRTAGVRAVLQHPPAPPRYCQRPTATATATIDHEPSPGH